MVFNVPRNEALAAFQEVRCIMPSHPLLLIRRAVEHEASALSAIAMAAKAHWPYTAAQLEAWRGDLTIAAELIASSPIFVAELKGEIAGFYSLSEEAGIWSLEHLWVAPGCMRRGLGRALLSHAVEFAAQSGAAVLAIDADPYAEPFYIACGARRVGAIAAPIEGQPARERPQLLFETGAGTKGSGQDLRNTG
jgi:GNAT superfamily N-acetyltransferase